MAERWEIGGCRCLFKDSRRFILLVVYFRVLGKMYI